MIDWSKVRYFVRREFDSPDEVGSGDRMRPDFVLFLDELRRRCGFPIVINSGYRTRARNAIVGGAPDSAHLRGWAVDIRAISSNTRFLIKKHAYNLGATRVGQGRTIVHVDLDPSLPQDQEWLYPWT